MYPAAGAGLVEVLRGTDQQAVDDAEHGGVGADAEAERHDHQGGEPGLAAEPARRVGQILSEVPKPADSTLLPAPLPVESGQLGAGVGEVAETPGRITPGRVGIDP